MNEDVNPYQTPQASVEMKNSITTEAYFFTTSATKLALMSVCTFGLYELYWFYKNWWRIKERTGNDIMPFWRAFFAPFWAYSCFKHVKTCATENAIPESLSIGLSALLYFILAGLWRAPDPYSFIGILSFFIIIPVNNVALRINQQLVSGFENNERFSGWNWVALFLGGSLIILSVIGAFAPEVLNIEQ